MTSPRIAVQKTWKMYVGGAFVRSESGRTLAVRDAAGEAQGSVHLVSRASRKDVRDAVAAALAAQPGWSGRTAYDRGQILYRLAEVLEARTAELASGLERAGAPREEAAREVAASVDRCVAWAGWADKFQALLSNANPVAGPHFAFTVPEPIGVVGAVAPRRPALLGLVSSVLPIVTAGNAVVVVASADDPRTAITFCEALATSDVPAGVVNVLTGEAEELGPTMARHREVGALDLWLDDGPLATELERAAADSVERGRRRTLAPEDWYGAAPESLAWIERFVEAKTIWHPIGV
jgi:acyl-CoA reductase-like NAD-dependent aldehyde dehydrogenase